jgi:TRAP transporter TAXI family solute receptor
MKKQLAAVVAATALLSASETTAQDIISIASLPQGTTNFFQASAIAKVVQQNSNYRMRVQPLRGSSLTLVAVNAGEAEFTLGGSAEMMDAQDGVRDYEGRQLKNLRIAFNNRPLQLGVFVRKDSGITRIDQLKGRRMPTGWKAFPFAVVYTNATLATAGLSLDDMIPVPVPDIIRAGEDFKEGKTDASVFAVGAPAVTEIASAVGGVRFLSISEGQASLDAVKRLHRAFYVDTVQPGPRMTGIETPTRVVAYDLVFVAGSQVPDEVVRTLVKVVCEKSDELAKAHASFNDFNVKGVAKQIPDLTYHSGAIKYYREIKQWPGS